MLVDADQVLIIEEEVKWSRVAAFLIMASAIYGGESSHNDSRDSLQSMKSDKPMMGTSDDKSTLDGQEDRLAEGNPNTYLELADSPVESNRNVERAAASQSGPVYKVYKRRFFGLAQLVLLNIVVSWDVSFQGDPDWNNRFD